MCPSLLVGQWIDPTAVTSPKGIGRRFDWPGRGQPLSLYDEALKEAERHKWIESQKHGRDLGDSALDDWFRHHWHGFCRHRRLEHVQGCQLWQEFEEEEFGQLYTLIVAGDLLLDRILDRIQCGCENLDLINWALDWGLPMERVLCLLTQLNINRARLEPSYRRACLGG